MHYLCETRRLRAFHFMKAWICHCFLLSPGRAQPGRCPEALHCGFCSVVKLCKGFLSSAVEWESWAMLEFGRVGHDSVEDCPIRPLIGNSPKPYSSLGI